jgi:hypothetical protein
MVAATGTDAVSAAGGWLFDRAMAGWEVTVLVAAPGDERPLRILGAEAADLADLAGLAGDPAVRPDALAVDVDLFETDQQVREFVAAAQHDGVGDVRFWGDRDTCLAPSQHRLSVAARAFKSHALAAARHSSGSSGSCETVEWFCLGDHSKSAAGAHAFSGHAG